MPSPAFSSILRSVDVVAECGSWPMPKRMPPALLPEMDLFRQNKFLAVLVTTTLANIKHANYWPVLYQ